MYDSHSFAEILSHSERNKSTPKPTKSTLKEKPKFVNKTLLSFSIIGQQLSIKSFLLVLAVTTSCSSPETDPVDPYSFFPLEMGMYRIYSVNEEVYSAGQKEPVKKSWKEKDEVIRRESGANGNSNFILSRSIWDTQGQYWRKIKEYAVSSFPDKIIVNLDNEIFTPLIFPYSANIKWDGYEYFNISDLDPRYGHQHHYEEINKPLQFDSLKFARTIKVSERSDTTGVTQYRLGFKFYASGVGLVADEQTDFEYLQVNGEIMGYRVIASGTRRVKRIVEYGALR